MSSLFGPRVAAFFGVAFAVLLFLGVASLDFPIEATDQEVLDWWSKDSNQTAALVSMAFVAFSGFALGLFVSFLRDRLNGTNGTAGNALFVVGLGAVAMLLATAGARGAMANALMNDEPLPGVDTLRFSAELSHAIMEVALMSVGVSIVLAAWAILKTRAFPAWSGWVSAVLGVLTVAGVVVVGPLVIPITLLWALAMSVAVWRSGSEVAAPVLRQASRPA